MAADHDGLDVGAPQVEPRAGLAQEALNFFMADMQAGIGPFFGGVAGMAATALATLGAPCAAPAAA